MNKILVIWITGTLLAACTLMPSVSAEIIEYSGTITITTTNFPGDIAVGDIFHIALTYDDSDSDTNASVYIGRFAYALQSFEITRDPGNTGTWDPTIGTWYLNPSFNHLTNANGDNMTMQTKGTGFDPLGGEAFFDASPFWQWDPSVHNIVDTGFGQTLRNQFGDVSPDFFATMLSSLSFRNASYASATGTLVPDALPTPTPTPCMNTGDCTQDGSITAEDAQMAFFITLGLITPDPVEFCAADCNAGGTVTAADAQQIFLTVLGLDNCADPLE